MNEKNEMSATFTHHEKQNARHFSNAPLVSLTVLSDCSTNTELPIQMPGTIYWTISSKQLRMNSNMCTEEVDIFHYEIQQFRSLPQTTPKNAQNTRK